MRHTATFDNGKEFAAHQYVARISDIFFARPYQAWERGSNESFNGLLRAVLSQGDGLTIDPKLAVGDGALGFWKALPTVFLTTNEQRCWMPKTANVLDKLPKNKQPRAKEMMHQIWMADTRENATKAFDAFLETYQAKYPKACECLAKDRDELLVFYDFRRSTGSTCGPPTRSSRHSPRSASGTAAPKATGRGKLAWP